MLNIYTIEQDTLTDIADAIRNKYNFKDKINPKDFPRYISNDSNDFWLTHYDTSFAGGGSIYNSSDFTIEPNQITALFKKNDNIPNGYTLQHTWNGYGLSYNHAQYKTTDLQLLSKGCSYSTKGEQYDLNEAHGGALVLHDDGVRLTNGVDPLTCVDPFTSQYSAWTEAFDTFVEIIVNLGSRKRVGQVKLYCIYNFWGVPLPENIKVGYSNTGRESDPFVILDSPVTYKFLKNGNSYVNNSGDLVPSKLYEITIDLDRLVYSQYIKIMCQGRFVWLNQVQVYGITNGKSYYGYKMNIAARDTLDIKDGELAIFNDVNNFMVQLDNIREEYPNEYDKYLAWMVRPTDPYATYYDVVGRLPEAISDFWATDEVVVYKGYTNNIDISVMDTETDKCFKITKDSVEFLTLTLIPMSHTIPVGEDEFIYKLTAGTSQADIMAARIKVWKENDTFILENVDLENHTIATETPWLNWSDPKFSCVSTYDIIENNTIIIDGNLSDSGWRPGGWYSIGTHNGNYTAGISGLAYNYKLKADDNYLYLAFSAPLQGIDTSLDNNITVARLWLRTNPEATIYTHYYGFSYDFDNGLRFEAKRNKSLNDNSPEIFADSRAVGRYINDVNHITAEIMIPLSEINGEEEIEYFFCHGNAMGDKLVTLYAQKDMATVPYTAWDTEHASHFATADQELGSDEILNMIKEELL